MGKSAAAVAAAGLFVGWDEVFVSNDKGKRVVHYYLNRRDGGSDLAVVGKEKSLRHMSYYYALRNRSLLLSLAPSSSSLLKLRSRRDVVDWLSSIVPDSPSLGSSQVVDGSLDLEDGHDADVPAFKDLHLRKLEHHSKEFSWLGPSESGRKRRRHYQSFCRNGITISVHDFVYIMAEENKRLVAYLEDLYEDSKGNKMVVVQWFHKIDEVDTVLPAKFNGREIFFSLSRQDLSVECIDGLATILSPQHFEKFLNEATHTRLEPFVCHNMVENDDVKPFDITQVQGYWKQEIIRYMYTTSHRRTSVKPDHVGLDVEVGGNDSDDAIRTRPKKRRRLSKSGEVDKQRHSKMEARDTTCVDIQKSGEELAVSSSGAETCAPKEGRSATALSRKETISQRSHQLLAVGSHVEVLSQDSGIRGCWFRALILKRHKDKVKVRYEDIRDAADEALNLEEWILASKVAVPDYLGLRLCGRTTLRPYPLSNKGRVFDVGTSVDVWWCDGWWEGIVLQKESEDKIHVYFPGERRTSIFAHGDLRHSQDWVGNEWKCIKERPDIVRAVLSGIENKQDDGKPCDGRSHPVHVAVCENEPVYSSILPKDDKDACNKSSFLPKDLKVSSSNKSNPHLESRDDGRKEMLLVPNLANDDLLAQLKWKSSRKRRHRRERMQRRGGFDSNRNFDGFSSSSPEDIESPPRERFIIPKSLKLDHDNCKYRDDSLFNASITPLASLVMSR